MPAELRRRPAAAETRHHDQLVDDHQGTRAETEEEEVDVSMLLWGYALVTLSFLTFVFGLYGALFSSHMPLTGNKAVDAVRNDEHYKYLVPLTVPVTLVAIITNWGAFKHWRHSAS